MSVPAGAGAGSHSLAGITIRPAREDDDGQVMELLASTLGWQVDARHRELFLWKHRTNPFGSSPGWVAEDGEGIVGFRALMRWEFRFGGQTVRAVRAVDTATHPRAQGRGIFRALTMNAVEDATADGVSWVFNTPNTQSAPGYLSMGWEKVGHVPASLRPSGVSSAVRLVTGRHPADLWSLDTSAGEDAASVLQETVVIDELLASRPSSPERIRTARTAAYLLWRFGRCPVGYRILLAGRSISDGVVIFRVRKRGRFREALIADVILPGPPASGRTSSLLKQVRAATSADYAITLGIGRPRGWLPIPGGGPLLTWRRLDWNGAVPGLQTWDLSAGDIELF